MSVLAFSQHITGPADLQIPHGNFKSGPQFRKFLDSRQTLLCHFFQHFIPFVHQKCIGGPVAASYPPPQLIQLRQAKPVRILNDNGVYIGDIQTRFYNRSGNQHINLSFYKLVHDFFQFPLIHLSMGVCHHCLRHQFGNLSCHDIHIGYPIVDIIHLATPGQFTDHRFSHDLRIFFHYKSLDRHTVHRRLFQHTHITDAHQAHVQRSRNWCCRQCQHINIIF